MHQDPQMTQNSRGAEDSMFVPTPCGWPGCWVWQGPIHPLLVPLPVPPPPPLQPPWPWPRCLGSACLADQSAGWSAARGPRSPCSSASALRDSCGGQSRTPGSRGIACPRLDKPTNLAALLLQPCTSMLERIHTTHDACKRSPGIMVAAGDEGRPSAACAAGGTLPEVAVIA
jgi:hypothetical protein